VSEDNAIANLDAEVPGWDFDRVRADARNLWTQALAAVDVDAPAPMRTSFYTALYHALQAPSLFMDSDGTLSRADNAVHQAHGWATYRRSRWGQLSRAASAADAAATAATHQRCRQFTARARRESPYGILPVWAFQGQETWCMIGYHACR
jgi:putative alpha-1,2-mannosidase